MTTRPPDSQSALLPDPDGESAYDFFFGLIQSQSDLDCALRRMLQDDLLTEAERRHLERPNSTYRQRLIVVRDVLIRHPRVVTNYTELGWLPAFSRHVENERTLQAAFKDALTLRRVFGRATVATGELRAVRQLELTGSINHPQLAETSKGTRFLRYTSALGGKSFLRFAPKETIFRHVLGERTFRQLLGPESTTRTIYPSLKEAFENHLASEPDSIEGRIAQRLLFQDAYTDGYFRLQEYHDNGRDFGWMLSQFAAIIADIHAATAGAQELAVHSTSGRFTSESQELVRRFLPYYKYSSASEYAFWLREVNWVTRMVVCMDRSKCKDFPPTDLAIIDNYERAKFELHQSGIDVVDRWWRCVDESIKRWSAGAVLSGPDVKPSNVFSDSVGRPRLFDFDYFAFFDPAYHLGQSLYTVLRFATTREGEMSPKSVRDCVQWFCSQYAEQLDRQARQRGSDVRCITDAYDEFIEHANAVAAITFLHVMAHDVKERNLSRAEFESVVGIARSLLERPPW